MNDVLFIVVLSLLSGVLFLWGVKALPGERRQILAAVPVDSHGDGRWSGVNFTWYGLLTANAYVVAVAMVLILLGGVGVPVAGTFATVAALLVFCVPASRVVARLVEKKAHTFTVGGAVFVGMLIAPWVVVMANRSAGAFLGFHVPVMAALAAVSIAYAFGEGLGRLACVSFGCCYGKRLSACHPLLQRAFRRYGVIFTGKTKKIAYAGGMEGVKVLPVQALTYVIYVGTGLLATLLFLRSHCTAAFVAATTVTQGWRVLSELLRDDYRGAGKISAYQVMGVVGILYAWGIAILFGEAPLPAVELARGILTLWNPFVILALQLLWFTIFLYTGRSMVTGATISFHVHPDRI